MLGFGPFQLCLDRDELRREWLSPAPHLRSALALQAVVFGSSNARGTVAAA